MAGACEQRRRPTIGAGSTGRLSPRRP
jgi:hypothetical protein